VKRRAFKVVLLLLLGAIINVAVAWALAVCVDPNGVPMEIVRTHSGDKVIETAGVQRRLGHVRLNRFRGDPFSDEYYHALIRETRRTGTIPSDARSEDACGLPFASLKCHTTTNVTLYTSTRKIVNLARNIDELEVVGGVKLRPWDTGPTRKFGVGNYDYTRVWRALPYHPLWPGFAVNTVFYAGMLWMLFAASFALLRRRRKKHGLCPACAYPVGASNVCTECGKALTHRTFGSGPHHH
jgi:hypothetical protein